MENKKFNSCGCVFYLFIFLFNIAIGGISVNYILSWFGENIPALADCVIGLFIAELSVPIAIVGWILKICGVF